MKTRRTDKRVPSNTHRRGDDESMEDEEHQQEEMEEYDISQEEEWKKKLRRALREEDGLTPEQAMRVMHSRQEISTIKRIRRIPDGTWGRTAGLG